jgi:hypothetical protein
MDENRDRDAEHRAVPPKASENIKVPSPNWEIRTSGEQWEVVQRAPGEPTGRGASSDDN